MPANKTTGRNRVRLYAHLGGRASLAEEGRERTAWITTSIDALVEVEQ